MATLVNYSCKRIIKLTPEPNKTKQQKTNLNKLLFIIIICYKDYNAFDLVSLQITVHTVIQYEGILAG